ncbi:MAG: hypothetical protein FWD36_03405, partial [Treponema sp.]|nr:hypothetical protein [Treponema sp.]
LDLDRLQKRGMPHKRSSIAARQLFILHTLYMAETGVLHGCFRIFFRIFHTKAPRRKDTEEEKKGKAFLRASVPLCLGVKKMGVLAQNQAHAKH